MPSEWKRRSRHDLPRLAGHSYLVRMEAGIGIWMARDTSALETFKAARAIGTDMLPAAQQQGILERLEAALELWL